MLPAKRHPTARQAQAHLHAPHVDTGDFIVIVNADKIRVTGNQAEQKTYYRHSGYPGSINATSPRTCRPSTLASAHREAPSSGTLEGPPGLSR